MFPFFFGLYSMVMGLAGAQKLARETALKAIELLHLLQCGVINLDFRVGHKHVRRQHVLCRHVYNILS